MHLPLTHYEQSPLDNPLCRLFWGQFPVERAAALFSYEPQSPTSHMIYDMKYRSMPEIGEGLGMIIARQFAEAGFFMGIDVLMPVPITRRRQWQRGYNQSMEIARGVKMVTGLPICHRALRRTHFQESQTNQHAWERQRNVEGAFRLVSPDSIAGKHILLIDDIITTGATAIACGRELAKAEGVKISVLSIGYTKE